MSSFIIFDLWSITFWNFAAEMIAVVEKLHFSCPVELFEDLFLRLMKLFIFLGLQAESFQTFGMKTFGRVVDTETKNTSLKNFSFCYCFGTSGGSLKNSKKNWQSYRQCIRRVQRNFLSKIVFPEVFVDFFTSLGLNKKVSEHLSVIWLFFDNNFSEILSKVQITCPHKCFAKTKLFSKVYFCIPL